MSRETQGAPPAVIDVVEEPIPELAGLRAVDPPPALVARVMTRVAEPAAPTLWQWLRRPFRIEIRMSPLGALWLGVGLTLGMALVVAPRSHGGSVAYDAPAAASENGGVVLVRFTLQAHGARRVAVAGSFNNWSTDAVRLEDVNHDGVFVATVPLSPGVHEYMFVVDGEWVPDPLSSEMRPDGFGRQNSLLRL